MALATASPVGSSNRMSMSPVLWAKRAAMRRVCPAATGAEKKSRSKGQTRREPVASLRGLASLSLSLSSWGSSAQPLVAGTSEPFRA